MKPIIYEDENIIIVDKPAGLTVHPTSTEDKRGTLVSFLVEHYPLLRPRSARATEGQAPVGYVGDDPLRSGIVHRLDKETSGLMVVAKNNETFYELKKQFQKRKVEKKYTALVSGVLEQETGIIDAPLVKMGTRTRIFNFQFSIFNQVPNTKYQIPNTEAAKTAITEYRVLKRFKDYTLVEVAPKTGRQHQIRVHFASINHPVACDKLYGRKAKKCPSGLKRHFLHASYLKFRIKNALMEFEVALPEDLKETLKLL